MSKELAAKKYFDDFIKYRRAGTGSPIKIFIFYRWLLYIEHFVNLVEKNSGQLSANRSEGCPGSTALLSE
ncbi:MAG: hypothetical protein A2X81_12195 [Desulfobacterales bacterium GWB2_56_26]|nr:MAG: hypothetical protein A2X81_12195 [Desulfobacterales bacterium GWB2_56_26]